MTALLKRAVALAASALMVTLFLPSTTSAQAADLPSSFQWSSSEALISPQPDAEHDIVSVKDPTVVRHEGEWHVFATIADTDGGWHLTYTSFSDFSEAGSAPQHHLDTTDIGPGYRAAPQVFYFAPEQRWYLVYQTGVPSYSTTTDISDPNSWSAPRDFQDGMPDIIADNIGDGHWVDFWVTCDDAMCYLFSSDDNGHLYRAETTLEEFPNGFGNTQIALEDDRNDLFEASNVYKVADSDTYLLIVEAIGAEGRRYFRSWTSDAIDGSWTPLAATEDAPFAGAANVTFPSGRWTEDISHGEMIRSGIDQTMRIDPCEMRYLYQGMDPSADGDYSQLPWRLGLLTQTNSSCDSDDPEDPDDPGDPGDPGEPVSRCAADYRIANEWGGGFQAEVTVHNTGDSPISNWRVEWTPENDLSIDSLWNATLEQEGSTIAVRNASWNGGLAADSSTTFGFTASGTPAVPETTCAADVG